jgi:hypothetical protein
MLHVMRKMVRAEYETMAKDAEVLARDKYGEKVLRLSNGEFVKLFRRRRRISSAAWNPYAVRFTRAAERLTRLGVPTVDVLEVFRVAEMERDIVRYRPLPGETLRDTLAGSPNDGLLSDFARFLAQLHERGVYFRAIHLGNVIVIGAGRFGLIDVCDTYFGGGSLGLVRRVRNFKPLVRGPEDRESLEAYGGEAFLDHYLEAAGLGGWREDLLQRGVARMHRIFQ